MNRGSHRIDRQGAVLRSPFNEAPIHESGKYPAMPALRLLDLAFNEAPIHESGKSVLCFSMTMEQSGLQ